MKLEQIHEAKYWKPATVNKHNCAYVSRLHRDKKNRLIGYSQYGEELQSVPSYESCCLEWIVDCITPSFSLHLEQLSMHENIQPQTFIVFHNGLWLPKLKENIVQAVDEVILSLRVNGFLLDTWLLKDVEIIVHNKNYTVRVDSHQWEHHTVKLDQARFVFYGKKIFGFFGDQSTPIVADTSYYDPETRHKMMDFFREHPKEFFLHLVKTYRP